MKSLIELCSELEQAKLKEEKARAARIEIEEEILQLTGKELDASKTYHAAEYSIVVKWGTFYKADLSAIEQMRLPPDMTPIKNKKELDVKGYKWLMDNKPALFAQVSKHVISTPGKPSITLKKKED